MNPQFWHGRRVFLTGHTGFKGSWLALWLQQLGAQVTGYALPSESESSLYKQARVGQNMHSITADVRDLPALKQALQAAQPDIVIHMAAQALVRKAYTDPVSTYSTNVIGTVHLLEAARTCSQLRAVVNITTDKCYENREWLWPYRENDQLGGHDPYSSSKACAELVTQAYCRSFSELGSHGSIAVATARAGNVIGGGDTSADRLIPDAIHAWRAQQPLQIRAPHAIRPWQFVLDPLYGYLTLAQRLYEQGQAFSGAWNFGPDSQDALPVHAIVERMAGLWGPQASWNLQEGEHPHEAMTLKLDCHKAHTQLGWRSAMPLDMALEKTVQWYRAWLDGRDLNTLSREQIRQFQARILQP